MKAQEAWAAGYCGLPIGTIERHRAYPVLFDAKAMGSEGGLSFPRSSDMVSLPVIHRRSQIPETYLKFRGFRLRGGMNYFEEHSSNGEFDNPSTEEVRNIPSKCRLLLNVTEPTSYLSLLIMQGGVTEKNKEHATGEASTCIIQSLVLWYWRRLLCSSDVKCPVLLEIIQILFA